MIAGIRLEPAGVEVEEGDYKDGQQEAAVDAGPVEEVGGGDEENKVDGGSVGAVRAVVLAEGWSLLVETADLRLTGRRVLVSSYADRTL